MIKVPPESVMRACTFGLTATMRRIRGTVIKLNAVESASASVAVGAITVTVLYSDGLRPVAGSNKCVKRPFGSNRKPAPADVATAESTRSTVSVSAPGRSGSARPTRHGLPWGPVQ